MINLLPTDLKQDYRYARRNVKLVKWAISFVAATLGLVIITGAAWVLMNNAIGTYNSQAASTDAALARQDVAGTEKQVTDISNNLKLMVSILSKEILFSQLLARLGNITPPKVILTGLSISQTESAIDITAQTTDYSAAAQLQANLSDPTNQIFSKADIVDISCAKGASVVNPNYPCTANIRALFKANNPFLFINASKGGA